jgi:hypothetical protein
VHQDELPAQQAGEQAEHEDWHRQENREPEQVGHVPARCALAPDQERGVHEEVEQRKREHGTVQATLDA